MECENLTQLQDNGLHLGNWLNLVWFAQQTIPHAKAEPDELAEIFPALCVCSRINGIQSEHSARAFDIRRSSELLLQSGHCVHAR